MLQNTIFLVLLLGYYCAAQNFTCPSKSGNSSEICQKNVQLCCDYECVRVDDSCKGFKDDKVLVWIVFALSALTDLGQILIAIWYHKVFFHRLTWGEKCEGYCYRNFTKHFEKLITQNFRDRNENSYRILG